MAESTVLLAALGVVGTISTGLIWLLKKLFEQNDKTLSKNTEAVTGLTKTLSSINDSLTENAEANRIYRKENEDFRETAIRYLMAIDNKADDINDKADRNYLVAQEVKEQTVIHQTVINPKESNDEATKNT